MNNMVISGSLRSLNVMLFCLLCGILISSKSYSQKTNFDEVSIKHIWLPEDFLPYDITTYRSFVSPNKGHQLHFEIGDNLHKQIDLYSFSRVDSDYDLEVALILDSLNVYELKVSSHAYYSMPARLLVRDYSNNKYLDTVITLKNKYSMLDVSNTSNLEEQISKYNKYKRVNYSSWEGTLVTQYIQIVNHILEKKYAYRPYIAKHSVGIPINDKKSNFDYSEYNKAFNLIKSGFEERNPEDLDTGNEKISQAITIWENKISLSSEEKERNGIDKKVMYLTHLNCAVGYLWLSNFEMAKEQIDLADEFKGALSGGGYGNTRNSIEKFNQTYNLHPNWKGKRISEPRKGENVFLNEGESYEMNIALNNEWIKNNPITIPKNIDSNSPMTIALVNKSWKYQKIIQIYPEGTQEVKYEIDKMDGEGISSHEKERKYFNIDGSYTNINFLGEKIDGNQWEFYSNNSLMLGMEIVDILSLTNESFTYKGGKEGGFQVIYYMIPDIN